MTTTSRELQGAILGTLLAGLGGGTATVAAFQARAPGFGDLGPLSQTVVVTLGFVGLFAGVRLSQAHVHRSAGHAVVPSVDFHPIMLLRGLALCLGVLGLAIGLILFAEAIASQEIILGGLSGAICLVGYLLGHVGMNGSVI
ncbi:MAG: hypothetical protein U5K37_09280 [Natrialbaceae archaeon]|nr:hypothetical protein [Natrialbaceae archaeon]